MKDRKFLGLKNGKLYCIFEDEKQAIEDITGETDYVLVLSSSDIQTLKKWLEEEKRTYNIVIKIPVETLESNARKIDDILDGLNEQLGEIDESIIVQELGEVDI